MRIGSWLDDVNQMKHRPEYTSNVSQKIRELVEAKLEEMKLSARQVSLAVVGHDGLIRDIKQGRMPSIDKLSALFNYLKLELYFGEKRELTPPETEIDGARFATVARYDAVASAGVGAVNVNAPPIDHLAFSKAWLQQNSIDPAKAILVNVRGDSMAPKLCDGDLIMLDGRRTALRSNKIYAFNDGDETRVKRLEMLGDVLLIKSDNPDYPTEARTGAAINTLTSQIIGEVVWSGHRWE